jgi:hypothetical protein
MHMPITYGGNKCDIYGRGTSYYEAELFHRGVAPEHIRAGIGQFGIQVAIDVSFE